MDVSFDYVKIIPSMETFFDAGGAPFTPASLPNLVAWYTADVGVYSDLGTTPANNNDLVEQWNDQSGNGNNAIQILSANRPTFNTSSALNSQPGIVFSGVVPVKLLMTSQFSFGGTTLSVFMVTQDTGATSFGRYLAVTGTTGLDYNTVGNAAVLLNDAGGTNICGYRANSQLGGYAKSTNTNYRFGGIFDGSNYTLYINNVAQTSPPASTGSFDSTISITIGCDPATSGGLTGVISEVVVTSGALGSADRNSLDAYFQSHWGL